MENWNVTATNKKNCFSAIGHACANTLFEEVEVVGEAVVPYVLIWPSYEVAVLQRLAGHLVNDRFGRAWGIVGYKRVRWLVRVLCFGSYQGAHGVDVAGACYDVTDGDVTG